MSGKFVRERVRSKPGSEVVLPLAGVDAAVGEVVRSRAVHSPGEPVAGVDDCAGGVAAHLCALGKKKKKKTCMRNEWRKME